ncbi:MAG TPA: carboxypeptidase regulatory-like domain-containing protein [Acidobacteriaceae bacterium]|jgi:hypothetical protein
MTFIKHSWPRQISLALLGGVLCASAAHAQFRTSVQGTVTDPDGAVIPGATLTLKDLGTNQTTVRTSDPAGVFNFNALPADHFSLSVEHAGFQKKVLNDLQFIPEQANSVNVQLAIGGATETVEVDASALPAIDRETSNIGGTISANEIEHLPSASRDVFTLTQLVPGAISDGSQGAGGGVFTNPGNQGPGGSGNGGQAPTENGPQANANGQAYGNNGITIDGISTVSAVWGGTTVITPTEESVDNVRIVTNDYDAENGRFSGAQTMVTSKSGTNQLHGSAFISVHRPGLNAYNRFVSSDSAPVRDTARFNQYGGSLGGPLWRDKLFAFFAYEASPLESIDHPTGWYETSAFEALGRTSSIASKFLTFPGGAVSSTSMVPNVTCATAGLTENVNCRTIAGQGLNIGSPLSSTLGTHDPSEGGTTTTRGIGGGLTNTADIAEYVTSSPVSKYYRQYNGRVDANVTKNDRLTFALYWVPQGSTFYNGGARAYNLFHHDQINDAFSLIWNHTFSPSFVNEARANAAGWRWNEITSNPQAPVGLPQDNIDQIGSISIGQFGSSLGSDLNQWTYGYKDVATKISGRHTIKFGGDYTNLHYLNNPTGRPNYSFYNVWDFLNDAPREESGTFNPVTGFPGGTRSDDREGLWGFFVQDDWKFRPNLTIHAGLRYSYFGSLTTRQNNLSSVQFGTGSSLYTGIAIKVGGNLYKPQKGNFGPQVGFNWAPEWFHNKMVVRGGYGLNFNQEELAITANAGNNPPTQSYYDFKYNTPIDPGNGVNIVYGVSSNANSLNGFASNPHTITTFNTAGLPTAGNANIVAFGNFNGVLPTPYAQHYSLDTEYEFGPNLVASLGYQGSASGNVINHETPNAAGIVAGVPLNPLVTGGDYWTNAGFGNNNSLLAELKHPMVHHFSADAQFMWAKSLDTDGSGPYYEDEYFPLSPGASYGRSEFDVEKSFKAFGVWQPVLFHGHSWMEKIAGNWTLTGIFQFHTGFPWNPTYPTNGGASLYCSNCGYSNLRPVYQGGAGHSGSNSAFIAQPNTAASNFPNKGANTLTGNTYRDNYFFVPNYTAAVTPIGGGFPNGNASLPTMPHMGRNQFTGPSYRDVDASLSKGFGLPNNRILGENAKLEIRADAFNLFNLLNLNPGSISTNITAGNFGRDVTPLSGRVIDFQARFSF